MEKKALSILLVVFVTAIIGIILASTLADTIYENVTPLAQTNESLNIAAARTEGYNITESQEFNVSKRTAGETLAGVSEIRLINGTVLTSTTDYIANVSGDQYIYFKNSSTMRFYTFSNITLVDYTHQTSQYVQHSTSRTLLNVMLPLFFIIALVVFVIFAIKKGLVDKVGM